MDTQAAEPLGYGHGFVGSNTGMNKIAYKLPEAASALDLDEPTLTTLRDHGLLITYRIGRDEYVSDFALRDLQHRLEVGIHTE